MKFYDCFVVNIPKRINDTITLESGLELTIDNRFDEFANRVNEAEVMYVPFKFDTGVSEGDTLYFHHLVVINDGQPLTGEEDMYIVKYNEEHTINSQAFCYRPKGTKEIIPLSGWCILEPIEEEEEKLSEVIEVVTFSKKTTNKAKVAYRCDMLEEYGLKVGDVVGYKENMDYTFKIDGKEYYRTRLEDLLYVEE